MDRYTGNVCETVSPMMVALQYSVAKIAEYFLRGFLNSQGNRISAISQALFLWEQEVSSGKRCGRYGAGANYPQIRPKKQRHKEKKVVASEVENVEIYSDFFAGEACG